MPALLRISGTLLATLLVTVPAFADWKAGNNDTIAAVRYARIAAALQAVNTLDQATVSGDTAAFAALLSDDLAVNNPQNGVSVRGATGQRSAAGKISYTRYDRIIEYAGLREGMVLLMGEEIVYPRNGPLGQGEVHRRFTDLWQPVGGHWKLTARQATVIARP